MTWFLLVECMLILLSALLLLGLFAIVLLSSLVSGRWPLILHSGRWPHRSVISCEQRKLDE